MRIDIVVFGCDNSGKTTLCNTIASYLKNEGMNAYVTHSCGPGSILKHINFLAEVLKDKKDKGLEIQIFDRFPIIEEFVCGNVLRGFDSFKPYPESVSKFMGKVPLFIHCDPGIDFIENWGEREQMDGIKENARNLFNMYKAVPMHFNIESRTVKYDYTKDNPSYLSKSILDFVWFLYRNMIEHWGEEQ